MITKFRDFLIESSKRQKGIEKIVGNQDELLLHIAFIHYFSYDPDCDHHIGELDGWIKDIFKIVKQINLKRDDLEKILFSNSSHEQYNIDEIVHAINDKIDSPNYIKNGNCTKTTLKTFIDKILNSIISELYIKKSSSYNLFKYIPKDKKEIFDELIGHHYKGKEDR